MARPLRLSLRTRSRGRRSQAERTAETRARIVRAVVESLAEVGFQRTTASEIVERAGVTWGAVQHHFGRKDGILAAVLEDSFERFAARLADVQAGVPLEERAYRFVDRAWEHFSSPHYRSTFEILLNHLPRADSQQEPSLQQRMFEAWDGLWRRLFADARLPLRRRVILAHYTLSVLSGLAATLALEGDGAGIPSEELDLLKRTLVRELAPDAD
jgi:AcrR family transcriptional regulator